MSFYSDFWNTKKNAILFSGFAITSGYSSDSKLFARCPTSQTERQLKSAGAILGALNIRYYTFDDEAALSTAQESRNWKWSVGPAYASTYVTGGDF